MGGDGKAGDANRSEASGRIEEQKGKSDEGLSVQVRKVLMGRAFNYGEEWGQEEMSVGELGRRMMAEEWSMNEKAVMKSRKLTGRELCRDGPGSSDEHRMQSSFRCLESYSEQPSVKTGSKLESGGDASDHDLKLGEAWVRAKYKCVARK